MNETAREPGMREILNSVREEDPSSIFQPRRAVDLDERPIERIEREIPYAPPASPPSLNAIEIANISVKSVAALGAKASQEVEEIAASIQSATQEVVNKLHQLSEAMTHHANQAAAEVEALAVKTKAALEAANQLHEAFHKPKDEAQG